MSAASVKIAPSPMGLGDIFTTTFSVFRRRIGAFLGLTALQQLITVVLIVVPMVVATVVLIGQLISLDSSGALDSMSTLRTVATTMGIMMLVIVLASVVAGMISLYFTGIMITCANEATQQRFPTVSQLRTLSKGFFGRFVLLYVAAMLLYGLAIAVAMLPMGFGMARVFSLTSSGMSGTDFENQLLATMVGGLLLSWLLLALVVAAAFVVEVKLAYVMQVCALEDLSGMAALRRAWDITREAFWRTLGYLLVFGLAAGAAQQVVSAVGQAMMSMVSATLPRSSSSSTSGAAAALQMLQSSTFVLAFSGVYAVMIAVQLVIVPLKLTFVTVMYGDQVRRRELGPVAHAFGINVPGHQAYQGQPMYAPGPQQHGPAQGGYGVTGWGQPTYGQGAQYGQSPGGYPTTGPGYGQPPSTTPYGQPTSYGPPPAAQG
jgi:hypothetical protein